MECIYPYSPNIIHEDTDVIRIAYYNVELARFVRKKGLELLCDIATLEQELQRTFLRAFFDDEGCVSYESRKNRRRIRGHQHNLSILTLAQHLLMNFGIESRIDGKQVELIISKKHNLIRFRDEIGFSPGVRVNGKRSNSIWKQSLEKRIILDRAIASYLPPGTPGVHQRP